MDKDELESFQQEIGMSFRAMRDVLNTSKQVDDPAFEAEIKDLLGEYADVNPGTLLN